MEVDSSFTPPPYPRYEEGREERHALQVATDSELWFLSLRLQRPWMMSGLRTGKHLNSRSSDVVILDVVGVLLDWHINRIH